jgi:hypothetical protein
LVAENGLVSLFVDPTMMAYPLATERQLTEADGLATLAQRLITSTRHLPIPAALRAAAWLDEAEAALDLVTPLAPSQGESPVEARLSRVLAARLQIRNLRLSLAGDHDDPDVRASISAELGSEITFALHGKLSSHIRKQATDRGMNVAVLRKVVTDHPYLLIDGHDENSSVVPVLAAPIAAGFLPRLRGDLPPGLGDIELILHRSTGTGLRIVGEAPGRYGPLGLDPLAHTILRLTSETVRDADSLGSFRYEAYKLIADVWLTSIDAAPTSSGTEYSAVIGLWRYTLVVRNGGVLVRVVRQQVDPPPNADDPGSRPYRTLSGAATPGGSDGQAQIAASAALTELMHRATDLLAAAANVQAATAGRAAVRSPAGTTRDPRDGPREAGVLMAPAGRRPDRLDDVDIARLLAQVTTLDRSSIRSWAPGLASMDPSDFAQWLRVFAHALARHEQLRPTDLSLLPEELPALAPALDHLWSAWLQNRPDTDPRALATLSPLDFVLHVYGPVAHEGVPDWDNYSAYAQYVDRWFYSWLGAMLRDGTRPSESAPAILSFERLAWELAWLLRELPRVAGIRRDKGLLSEVGAKDYAAVADWTAALAANPLSLAAQNGVHWSSVLARFWPAAHHAFVDGATTQTVARQRALYHLRLLDDGNLTPEPARAVNELAGATADSVRDAATGMVAGRAAARESTWPIADYGRLGVAFYRRVVNRDPDPGYRAEIEAIAASLRAGILADEVGYLSQAWRDSRTAQGVDEVAAHRDLAALLLKLIGSHNLPPGMDLARLAQMSETEVAELAYTLNENVLSHADLSAGSIAVAALRHPSLLVLAHTSALASSPDRSDRYGSPEWPYRLLSGEAPGKPAAVPTATAGSDYQNLSGRARRTSAHLDLLELAHRLTLRIDQVRGRGKPKPGELGRLLEEEFQLRARARELVTSGQVEEDQARNVLRHAAQAMQSLELPERLSDAYWLYRRGGVDDGPLLITHVARRLGISHAALYGRFRAYGLLTTASNRPARYGLSDIISALRAYAADRDLEILEAEGYDEFQRSNLELPSPRTITSIAGSFDGAAQLAGFLTESFTDHDHHVAIATFAAFIYPAPPTRAGYKRWQEGRKGVPPLTKIESRIVNCCKEPGEPPKPLRPRVTPSGPTSE